MSPNDPYGKTEKQPPLLFRLIGDLLNWIWDEIGCIVLIVLLICGVLFLGRCINADFERHEAAQNKLLLCISDYKDDFKSGTIFVNGKEITGLLKINENKDSRIALFTADFQFLYPEGSRENRLTGATDSYSWNVSYREGNLLRSINIPNQVKFTKCDITLLIQDFTAVVQEE